MRTINEDGVEITEYDEELGYIVQERVVVQHHDEIVAVPEQFHYEVIKTYPNGGQDVKKVVDVPGVEHQDAFDEHEVVNRFIRYTESELAERQKKKEEEEEARRLIAEEAERAAKEQEELFFIVRSLPDMLAEYDEAICTLYEMQLEKEGNE